MEGPLPSPAQDAGKARGAARHVSAGVARWRAESRAVGEREEVLAPRASVLGRRGRGGGAGAHGLPRRYRRMGIGSRRHQAPETGNRIVHQKDRLHWRNRHVNASPWFFAA